MGPVSFQELAEIVRVGTITEDDHVRREIGGDWIRAGDVIGLFHVAQNQAAAESKPPDQKAAPNIHDTSSHSTKNSNVAPTRKTRQIRIPQLRPRVLIVSAIVLLFLSIVGYSWANRKSRIFPDSAIPRSVRKHYRPLGPKTMYYPHPEWPLMFHCIKVGDAISDFV